MISPTYAGQKALSSKNLATLLGRFLLTIFYLSIDKMQYIFKYVNNFLKKINKKMKGKANMLLWGNDQKSYVMGMSKKFNMSLSYLIRQSLNPCYI